MAHVRADEVKPAKAMLRNEGYSKTQQRLIYDYCRKEAVGDEVELIEVPKEQWATLRREHNYLARVGRHVQPMHLYDSCILVGNSRELTLEQIGQIWLVNVKESK